MKVDIRGPQSVVSEELQTYTKRRLHFALSRFASRLLNLTVHLATVQNACGSTEKQCRISVDILGSRQGHTEVLDSEFTIAIDRAADRIQGIIARELERPQAVSSLRFTPTRLPAAKVFRRHSRLAYSNEFTR